MVQFLKKGSIIDVLQFCQSTFILEHQWATN